MSFRIARLCLPVLVFLFARAAAAQSPDPIVLCGCAATTVVGWDAPADCSQPLVSPDLGWASTSAPLASPSNYFEHTFQAPAGSYRVWLRVRALNNLKANDSVFVQVLRCAESQQHARVSHRHDERARRQPRDRQCCDESGRLGMDGRRVLAVADDDGEIRRGRLAQASRAGAGRRRERGSDHPQRRHVPDGSARPTNERSESVFVFRAAAAAGTGQQSSPRRGGLERSHQRCLELDGRVECDEL